MLLGVVLSINGHWVYAEEDIFNEEELFSEDILFSEEGMIIEEETLISETVDEELNEKRIGVSGEVTARTVYTNYSSSDNWFGLEDKENQLSNSIKADIFFDARLSDGSKGFLSLEASYYPQGITETIYLDEILSESIGVEKITTKKYTDLCVNEFFVDANWKNRVYFRTGKQVLKWGRSYFWNPTDLINVERKDFFNLNNLRGGTYGIKVHIPFGVERNIYFFLGMDDAEEVDDLSFAGKYEFLAGNTEISLSSWIKKDYKPVYGFDISSRIADIDWRGEISLSRGDNVSYLDYDTLELVEEGNDWIPRASIGFTKFFDYGDISDRISLTGEVYYNGNGYDENIFHRIEGVSDPIEKNELKGEFLESVYEPYMNSKYYFAVFTSVNKFIVSNATLNLNCLTNLVDRSSSLSAGVSYTPLTDLTINLNVNKSFGDMYTEATFMGNNLRVELGTKISF